MNGDQAAPSADPSDAQTFRIFRDSVGMYQWTLTDRLGQQLRASQFGFAAAAGAFREIEALRARQGYGRAAFRDESGR